MRKLMLLAAMLAMVLVAAVPALAQDAGVSGDGDATGGDVTTTESQYQNQLAALVQDCSVSVNQGQYGDAGGDITTAFGDVTGAQCQQILNQVQAGEDATGAVNAVLGEGTVSSTTATDSTVTDTTGTDTVVADNNGVDDNGNGTVDESGEVAAVSDSSAASSSSAAAGTSVLPDTGGASLLTLGAGALLVGGGLIARRIFR